MRVEYLDIDGGNELFTEERENAAELLTILREGNEINLRWPDQDSFWCGKYVNSTLDVEVDETGTAKECLKIYFSAIHSK